MDQNTIELHDAIDANIRRFGCPYLSTEGESVSVDLLGSARMVRWQERKAEASLLGSSCWSELPQVYGRYGGGASRELVSRVKELEGAEAAIITDSGMGAAAVLFDVLLEPGDHALVARGVYNKTKAYLGWLESRVGIGVTLLDDDEIETLEARITERTRIVLVEIFTNPLLRAFDPERLVTSARKGRETSPRLRLVVDDTIATPWGVRTPLLQQGVDFVIASGTKALDGRDRNQWGYVASSHLEEMNAGMDVLAMRGGILDEMRSRSVVSDLEQARVRFERRCQSAVAIARFLDGDPGVPEVHHPSCPHHPDREVIDRCYSLAGSLVSFRLSGADDDETRHFCDVLAMTGVVRYALSFDGLATKVNHHRTVSEYFTAKGEVQRLGVDRLVRLAVGLEDPRDLVAGLEWALAEYRRIPESEVSRWQRDRARELGIAEEDL
jgi:cystathionine beta-lyase/cystathionine gamma-synthase